MGRRGRREGGRGGDGALQDRRAFLSRLSCGLASARARQTRWQATLIGDLLPCARGVRGCARVRHLLETLLAAVMVAQVARHAEEQAHLRSRGPGWHASEQIPVSTSQLVADSDPDLKAHHAQYTQILVLF